VYPVLEQMQRYTRSKSEFNVETERLETEEVFANVLSKVSSDELLTTIIEGIGAVSTSVVHSWSQKLGVV
jgi:nucleoside permease NupC